MKIPGKAVAFMGGSVRCLSWQLDGNNAKVLIEEARKSDGKVSPNSGNFLGVGLISLILIFFCI